MAESNSLDDVRTALESKDFKLFGPLEVWIANYIAPNPFSRKFTYSVCTFGTQRGRVCGKSLEFGRKCRHSDPPSPQFRFQVIVFGCEHAGVDPLVINLWHAASCFLSCSPRRFSSCTETEQVAYIRALVQITPRVNIYLTCADGEVSTSYLAWKTSCPVELTMTIHGSCLPLDSPSHVHATPPPVSSSGKKKKTTKVESDARKLVKGLGKLLASVNFSSDEEGIRLCARGLEAE